jgi:hypothetical protein
MPLPEVSHQGDAGIRRWRREQQMDVIGHQTVRVYTAPHVSGELTEVEQVDLIVRVDSETGATVVAPLNDVQRNIREDQSRLSRHAQATTDDSRR